MQNSPHKSKDKDSEHSQEIKFIKVNSMKGSERKREGKMSLAEKQIQI